MNRLILIALVTVATILVVSPDARAQPKPDLIVRSVSITADQTGLFVEAVKVVVMNYCKGSSAAQSEVQVSFWTNSDSGAKQITTANGTVKKLTGGETFSQTFDFATNKIGLGRHLKVTADPTNSVAEASEDNNTRTLYPTKTPVLITQYQCSPKT